MLLAQPLTLAALVKFAEASRCPSYEEDPGHDGTVLGLLHRLCFSRRLEEWFRDNGVEEMKIKRKGI